MCSYVICFFLPNTSSPLKSNQRLVLVKFICSRMNIRPENPKGRSCRVAWRVPWKTEKKHRVECTWKQSKSTSLEFTWTQKSGWVNFDFKDENHVSPPKLLVNSCQKLLKEAHDHGCAQGGSQEGTRNQQVLLWVSSAVSLHPQAMHMVQSLLCKEGVFRRSTWAPNYTFDFYPRFVIKNMFKGLIICIFPCRVNPLKESWIPCSTVLTKCFHISFQLDSWFHFWTILCNYFLM